jgi:hypothetical protein
MAKKTAPPTAQPTSPVPPAATNDLPPAGGGNDQPPAGTDQDTTTASIDDQMRDINNDIDQLGSDIAELTHLVVRSVRASFRRAGRTWTRTAQVVAKADFTPDQVEALKAEPNLAVTEISEPQAADQQADA